MSDRLIIVTSILLISSICLILLIIANRNYNKKMQERALRMSYSEMFLHLLPFLNKAKQYAISNLMVNNEGVHIYFFNNAPYKSLHFNMVEHGFYKLSNQNINVLLLLLEQSITIIQNKQYYEFKRSKTYAMNGSANNVCNYHAKLKYYEKVGSESRIYKTRLKF